MKNKLEIAEFRPGHGQFHVDKQVVITLGGKETYAGTISFITKSYMEINAIHLKTSTTFDCLKCYNSDITFIQLLKSRSSANETVNFNISTATFCDFTLPELLKITNMLNNYIFIERFDKKYHDAIEDINSEAFIGLYIPGIEMGRFSDVSVVAVSTSKSIYIFDIINMGRIEKSLKTILEANVPKKIIHDGCHVGDYLMHHQIDLNAVFDTMVAHCTLGFDKSRHSLNDCLHDHLKLPEQFLNQPTELWHRRPLDSSRIKIAGQNVLFLQRLHLHLTRLMLKELYTQFDLNMQ